jgi:hypothetical protein
MAADLDNAEIVKAYKATFSYSYWTWMAALNGHQHAINLFEDALRDSALWLVNDSAVKQVFPMKMLSPHLMTKTEWDTTFFILEMAKDDDEEMWSEWSDSYNFDSSGQTTVADDSEVGNRSLLSKTCNSDLMIRWI